MARQLTVYAVCFDISDDKIRRRVAKHLLEHGDRVQHSVFELAFRRQSQLKKLANKLHCMLEESDDIRFYRLCQDCIHASQQISNAPIGQWPAAILVS